MEVVVTILILGIIAGIAMPRLTSSLAAYRAEAAAKRLMSDLVLAQKRALTTGSRETVTFNLVTNRYAFPTIADPDGNGSLYEVDLTEYPYHAEISRATFATAQSVTFDGYGFPNSSGKVALNSGGVVRVVYIDAASGKVTVGDE